MKTKREDNRLKIADGLRPVIKPKGWGHELWLHNSPLYAFKALHFKKGGKGSLHYHLKKTETWWVAGGAFEVLTIDPATARRTVRVVVLGDVVHLPAGTTHQVKCMIGGLILEASTQHSEDDTYRVEPGDSQ